MRRITVNKIASVAARLDLRKQVVLGQTIPATTGTVIAGRVLTSKNAYNKLEDVGGRMTELRPGDVIIGALGERHALHGYSGQVPASVAVGDRLQLLNIGGVLGVGATPAPGLGAPHEIEVLGSVQRFDGLERSVGQPANIADAAWERSPLPEQMPPVLTLLGTAMDAGKTTAAAVIIGGMTRRGLRVAAGKLTGVSLRRDILQMADAGAEPVSLFTDFGVVTSSPENAPPTARAILAHLAEAEPDVIVLEMGDGLLGTYGVQAILDAPDLRQAMTATVLCAQDPVGAWGAQQLLAHEHDTCAALVSGPVTDNPVGRSFCEEHLGLAAHNALLAPEELVDACLAALALPTPALAASS